MRLLLCGLLGASGIAQAQHGCPDPYARNYNPAATINDGSCRYARTRARPVRQAKLARVMAETSGLQYTDGALWTIADSGSPAVLFQVDTATGQVRRQVRVTNFGNVDWEALAADAHHLYIGDFGNNAGNRRNLRILRVAKAAFSPAGPDSVAAEEIAFYYPDQTNFSPGTYRHNYDCEAFFFCNDSLHLFTKNWTDFRTRYYTVPARPGTHAAHLKATFDIRGLITDAALSPTGTTAALLGYNSKTGATFLWLLSDFSGTHFLAGNKRRLRLPNALRLGQVEGLCFVAASRLFLSNERLLKRFAIVPQRLYSLDVRRWWGPLAAPSRTSCQP